MVVAVVVVLVQVVQQVHMLVQVVLEVHMLVQVVQEVHMPVSLGVEAQVRDIRNRQVLLVWFEDQDDSIRVLRCLIGLYFRIVDAVVHIGQDDLDDLVGLGDLGVLDDQDNN